MDDTPKTDSTPPTPAADPAPTPRIEGLGLTTEHPVTDLADLPALHDTPPQVRAKLKLIYDLEFRAAKGHSLDTDRALMQEAASALREELGLEGVPLLPNGGFAPVPDPPGSSQNPT